ESVAAACPGGRGGAELRDALVARVAAEVLDVRRDHGRDEIGNRMLGLAHPEVDRGLARLDAADQVGEARKRRARVDGRTARGGGLGFGLAGNADHDTLTAAAGRSAARSLKIGTIGEARLRRD